MPPWMDRMIARAAALGAFSVPLALGVLAASPEPYWLDSPELTAAVQTLGVPHPPGHPLYVMLAKPFTLLPLGGIALRVALASAVFGAIASYLLFRLTDRLIGALCPDLPSSIGAALALAAALLASAAPGWWFQCVRAEVYSLQILLVLACWYPLILSCLSPGGHDDRLLAAAAFAFGLGLANHHFVAFATLPAAIPPLVWMSRTRGGAGAAAAAARLGGIACAGLAPYLFLPIRSAAGAPISLGGVHTPSDFLWVVSAKAYQKSMLKEHAAGLGERSLDAVYTMMGEVGPVILVAALAGLYLLTRSRRTRMSALVVAVAVCVTTILRAAMGFDPYNPDYYGYMMPAVAGLSVGAAALAAALLDAVSRRLRGGGIAAAVLAAALLALPVARARSSHERVDLSDFRATRLFLDLACEGLEPGSLVLVSYYKLFFALWSAPHVDGTRPDVTVVNPRLFGYPGYLQSTISEHGDLRPLARSMVVDGEVTEATLAGLALERPVRMEPDPDIDDRVARYLLPDGPLYSASPEPLAASDVIAASPAHLERWRGFYAAIGTDWKEHETWRMLSWYHYLDALFLARRGDREGASRSVAMAREIGNAAPQITGLEEALSREGRGPIDVAPFLPTAAQGDPGRSAPPGDAPR